jgi:hypothetical protein
VAPEKEGLFSIALGMYSLQLTRAAYFVLAQSENFPGWDILVNIMDAEYIYSVLSLRRRRKDVHIIQRQTSGRSVSRRIVQQLGDFGNVKY